MIMTAYTDEYEDEENPYVTILRRSFLRMLGVVVGVFIAAIVTYVIVPNKAGQLFPKELDDSLSTTALLINDALKICLGDTVCLPHKATDPGSGNRSRETAVFSNDRESLDALKTRMANLIEKVSKTPASLAASQSEWYLFSVPHRPPIDSFKHCSEFKMAAFYSAIHVA